MRAKGHQQGRFVARWGLKKLTSPPGSQYPLLVSTTRGYWLPVFFLCEWYRRQQIILLLLRQTGARLSEVLEITAGGYRKAKRAGRALVKNKGKISLNAEEGKRYA